MKEEMNELIRKGIVQSGMTQIPFTSWGRGQAVLLFCPGEVASELVAALAHRSRVIAPQLPTATSDSEFARWLGVLVDGLGLVQPSAVLVGGACVFANVARCETDRVARVETVSSVVPRDDEMAALVERLGL